MKYAFLGTRQPRLLPPAVVELYRTAAIALAQQGGTILSGATPGADQFAAEAALAAGGRVELFLPWALYEREWVQRLKQLYGARVQQTVFAASTHANWLAAARAMLPNGKRLATGSVALHARYYGMMECAEAVVVMPYVRLSWQVTERPENSRASSVSGIFGQGALRSRRTRIGGISGQSTIREQIVDKGGTESPIRFAQRLERTAFDLSDADDRERLLTVLREPALVD
jgi:hypothetical protein